MKITLRALSTVAKNSTIRTNTCNWSTWQGINDNTSLVKLTWIIDIAWILTTLWDACKFGWTILVYSALRLFCHNSYVKRKDVNICKEWWTLTKQILKLCCYFKSAKGHYYVICICLTLCTWRIAISFQWWPTWALFSMIVCRTDGTKCTSWLNTKWQAFFSLASFRKVTLFIACTVIICCTFYFHTSNIFIALKARRTVAYCSVKFNLAKCSSSTDSTNAWVNTFFGNTCLV